MTNLLFNSKTEEQLRNTASNPPHALLLQGIRGSGKTTTAYFLSAKILGISTEKLATHPYFQYISPDEKQIIKIDTIRTIESFLLRKVPGNNQTINRIVLIDDAEHMKQETQNALLKNLEEPPSGTMFILTSSDPNQLLSTVRSRVSIIRILQPTDVEITEYFKSKGKIAEAIDRAIKISGGAIGLCSAILSETEHPLAKAAVEARKLLSSNRYERLVMVNELSKDIKLTRNTLDLLKRMSQVALESSVGSQAERWQRILTASHAALQSLNANTNPKLTLTNLMLNLS